MTRRSAASSRRRLPRPLFNLIRGALLFAFTLLLGATLFVFWGAYNVSALQQHTAVVYNAIGLALERSIWRHASDIEAPDLSDPVMIERGLAIYRTQCVACHGAPGVGRQDFGKGLTPVPANLAETARSWSPAEIFWTTRNGIKMSGMPAWEFVYSDAELWSVVAFVLRLPTLSAAEYRALPSQASMDPLEESLGKPLGEPVGEPDPERGRTALQGYACTACHIIPGVIGPDSNVGPPLIDYPERRYIAGRLVNDFDNTVRWIRNPQEVAPNTAMPDLGVKMQHARDISAYLYTIE